MYQEKAKHGDIMSDDSKPFESSIRDSIPFSLFECCA